MSKASEDAGQESGLNPKIAASDKRKVESCLLHNCGNSGPEKKVRTSGHCRICGDVGSHFGAGGRNNSAGRLQRQQCFFKCCQFDSITTERTLATVIAQGTSRSICQYRVGFPHFLQYSGFGSASCDLCCFVFLHRRLTAFADVKELHMRH